MFGPSISEVPYVPLAMDEPLVPRLPLVSSTLAPPAFVSELMGLTVYQHIDGADDILADEPSA
jgi:hypothetical protein